MMKIKIDWWHVLSAFAMLLSATLVAMMLAIMINS